MLSVNIPVFNYDVTGLVNQLLAEASSLSVPFEIRVYDDGSCDETKAINRAVAALPGVVYCEMPENMGRAAIRNKMGFDSEYDLLLFIDADSKVVGGSYLKTYLDNREPGVILCGGTVYSAEKPKSAEKLLRWVYGCKREAVSAGTRNRDKGFIITSNNFLIEKKVFEKIHFREELRRYGHEDTLLGYDLSQNGYGIFHVDNPLEHIGLEDSCAFLVKTRQALDNLLAITENMLNNDRLFNERVNFLNKYNRITKILPGCFLRLFFNLFSKKMETNLCGGNPKILFFDLYKLGYYAIIKKAELA